MDRKCEWNLRNGCANACARGQNACQRPAFNHRSSELLDCRLAIVPDPISHHLYRALHFKYTLCSSLSTPFRSVSLMRYDNLNIYTLENAISNGTIGWLKDRTQFNSKSALFKWSSDELIRHIHLKFNKLLASIKCFAFIICFISFPLTAFIFCIFIDSTEASDEWTAFQRWSVNGMNAWDIYFNWIY